MKKIFAILLAVLMALTALTACGGSDAESSSSASEAVSETESVSDAGSVSDAESTPVATDLNGAKAAITALLSTTDVSEMPANAIYDDTGINPEDFEIGYWICESTGMSVETVAVYKAKDEEKGAAIRTLLQNKLTSLQSQHKDYPPVENYNMTLAAKIGGNGVYAYMVISPNVDAVVAAINGVIS
ncbi:MAG: DUF4358 domain-containing protein [Clostridia bacterium]|nr:DUF4358 domain-containing protein [Clostridia bacterium]